MCGIAGIMDFKSQKVDGEIIRKMTESMAHRGPNGEGVFLSGNIGLGHRRLSILDLSNAGSQPMTVGDVTITHNGEVYNYLEIKKELDGEKYKSGTDTEVIIRAYEKWGEKCVEKFNGIFAFAIWDEKKKQLFAVRDRFGVKPFYYSIYKNKFYFASEIKAILAAGVPAKPNDKIIHQYLTTGFYDHSEETFFEGIKQLMPGHAIFAKDGKIKIWRYWYLPEKIQNLKGIKDEECVEKFLSLLEDSSKLQLRSDVPVGISVSGGLDSSLLTAAVDKAAGGQSNFQLFHFVYQGKNYDLETPFVNLLAKRLGWDKPNIVEVNPADVENMASKIMWHEEQPFPGLPTSGWHKLYRNIGDTKTVVTLEGHGGDEMAAGYDYYVGSFLLDVLNERGAEAMLRECEAIAEIRGLKWGQELDSFIENGLMAYAGGGISADSSKFINTDCLNNKFVKNDFPKPKFEEPFDSYLLNIQFRELMHTKLPRVLRSVDRESMAFSRELRVPFLDHRLVEFSFSLPLEQKIHGGHLRYFMRNAAAKFLPKEISHMPKRSLPNPQRQWFQNELKPWIFGILSSESFRKRKYFNQEAVLKEYENYCRQPNPINSFHIWQWVNLELWLRTFIDSDMSANDGAKTIFFVIATMARVNFILRTDIFKILKEKGYRLIVISPFYKEDWFIKEFGGPNVIFEKLVRRGRLAKIWENFRNKVLLINNPRLERCKEIHSCARKFYRKKGILSGLWRESKNIFYSFILAIIPRKLRGSVVFWAKVGFYFLTKKDHRDLFKKYKPAVVVMASAGAEGENIPFLVSCIKFNVLSFAVDNNIDVFQFRYFSRPRKVTKWALFSEIQKKEAMEMQLVPESELAVTGPARYDHYFKGFKPMPREEFFKKIGADPKKKLITFGAKTPMIYPHNGDIIDIIYEAISKNHFSKPAQLFIRFDPGHNPAQYKDLSKKAIFERAEDFSHRDHIANLLYYSDVVISMGSTFCIEACMAGTPALWVGFDGYKKYPNIKDSYRYVYELDLFKRLLSSGGIPLVESPEMLVGQIEKYLKNRDLDKDKRQKLMDQEYFGLDGHAGERIADLIIDLVENN
ncbi:MAG: asparagine synthase (glutamine-hydrolyzing) [Candidatus Pacebacteria bacterium]|nr:asparagine synthase (glutamine-hydrolyzing) [Candidatus Paceibacterota bacterium]